MKSCLAENGSSKKERSITIIASLMFRNGADNEGFDEDHNYKEEAESSILHHALEEDEDEEVEMPKKVLYSYQIIYALISPREETVLIKNISSKYTSILKIPESREMLLLFMSCWWTTLLRWTDDKGFTHLL